MINQLKKISKSKFIIIYSDLIRNITSKKKLNIILKDSIKIIKKILKEKYTIIIPTYNFKFPENKVAGNSVQFITSGYLNKYLVKKFKFKRTNKPMYNYAVIGDEAKKILKLKQKTAWGGDSVIAYLANHNTIGLGINIDIKDFGWVVIHAAEEKLKVPYRYYKTFIGKNIDNNQKVSEIMFVRKLDKNLTTDSSNLYKKLKPKIKIIKYNSHKIYLVNLYDAYHASCKILSKNLYNLSKNEKN